MSQHAPNLPTARKPTVVGIYGIPGSGKSALLNRLKNELGKNDFSYYEGSEVIASVVPSGLGAFKKQMAEQEKIYWHELAIGSVVKDSSRSRKVAVVTGHFMFWDEGDDTPAAVCTEKDMQMFSHILYLEFPGYKIYQPRQHDAKRPRVATSVDHREKWAETEIVQLRGLCFKNHVLFSVISSDQVDRTPGLLRDFQQHNEEYNTGYAVKVLDKKLLNCPDPLETILVLDADKTLSPGDTGFSFERSNALQEESPLKTLFSSPMGYSYTAFRQATLMYEDEADGEEYYDHCFDVAMSARMYPEFVSLLKRVEREKHVGVVVVTCGRRRVWDMILAREGVSGKVKVVGGGRLSDGFVVTPAVKAALVSHLQEVHGLPVYCRGWSRGVPESVNGQRTGKHHENDGTIRMRQALLPSTVSPRMDTARLPLVNITDPEFIDSILSHLKLIHATDRGAAHLLTTPMRDARVAGPALRAAHHRTGWYLASEFLTSAIGLEEFPIPYVQGYEIRGHRLQHELQTLIVALMRGGEPMAFGVNDVFPRAMFFHADRHNDLTNEILRDRKTIILVNSAINSGKSICKFVEHISSLQPGVHIVVVAGVVQSKSVCRRNPIWMLGHDARLTVVALRITENQFTAGNRNRLFNTVYL